MTAAVDALARIDDGVALPGDDALAEVFDRHCQWGAQTFCLICGTPGGRECDTCTAAHDYLVERSRDL